MFKHSIQYLRVPLVTICSQELFKDAQFLTWLNNPVTVKFTWHKLGRSANEFSDVIVTYDQGEGSNSDMPEHVWLWLCGLMEKEGISECFIRLCNLRPDHEAGAAV